MSTHAAAITFFLVMNGTPLPQPMSLEECTAVKGFYQYALQEEVKGQPMLPQVLICMPTGKEVIPVWEEIKQKRKK